MKFGEFSVDDADGLALACALKLPAAAFSKGHILRPDDIARLQQAGLRQVTAVRLDNDDVGEDQAALMLACSVSSQHIKLSEATTGRVNIHATVKGIFTVDKATVDRLNAIDPSITFACLADHSRVGIGAMIATFKIIPLAVSRSVLNEACALLRPATLFNVMPFEEHSVSLIATELAQLKSSVIDKTARILDRRLAMCGNHLAREFRVAHSVSTLSEALLEIMAIADSAPKLIIVFGASAVIDDNDVIPAAIREAGGHVLRVGMPVDPGNLMVLGQIGICYVIGAPGCARSPKENGFDWILERILAGERPDAEDVARMGVGGLLMEAQMRQLPRQASLTPKVAIVLLAAGMATRMGVDGGHKLLAEFDGMPLIRRSALVAQNSNAASTVVVVGHREGDMRAVLSGLPMRLIANPEYASGVASSLGAGLAAVADEDPDGVLVMLADMPRVTSDDLNRLISAFQCAGGSSVVRAVSKGKRGNPVILPRSLNDAIFRLEGDVGARHLIETSGLAVIDVEIGAAASIDVDTLEAVIAAGGKPAKV